jgi:hypothetical protein
MRGCEKMITGPLLRNSWPFFCLAPSDNSSRVALGSIQKNCRRISSKSVAALIFSHPLRYFLFFLLIPLFLRATPNDGSILLMNDSPFILTAVVQASDGTFLAQFSIQPGQQRNFTTNVGPTRYQNPGQPDISMTPYKVVWQCPSEGYYSMCSEVSPGALCRANGCPGNHFCSPKQDKKKDQAPASTVEKKK